ncbi:hypothetical protein, partial [Microcystis aeruginosa]|uniref:hypothetical protein n=1 Tax=Microcystis aeruginosa TaxID=1126 RepID=UPI001C0F93EA
PKFPMRAIGTKPIGFAEISVSKTNLADFALLTLPLADLAFALKSCYNRVNKNNEIKCPRKLT